MDIQTIINLVWTAAEKTGPLATVILAVFAITQYRRAEQERGERIKLQELINGCEDMPGLIERVVKGLNDGTNAINSMNDTVRPLVNAVVEKVTGK